MISGFTPPLTDRPECRTAVQEFGSENPMRSELTLDEEAAISRTRKYSAGSHYRTQPQADQPRTRFERIKAAIDDLKDDELKDVDFTRFYGIIVILNLSVDAGSVGILQLTFGENRKDYGSMVLGPAALNLTFAAHEMGHSYGLDHSFDTNPVSNDPANDPRPGAYGDAWDIMSAMRFGNAAPFFQHPRFGASGPGLNAIISQPPWLATRRPSSRSGHDVSPRSGSRSPCGPQSEYDTGHRWRLRLCRREDKTLGLQS